LKLGIVYDSTDSDSRALCDALCAALSAANHSGAEANAVSTVVFDAANGRCAPCVGCFGCWIKTPGVCVLPKDEGTRFVAETWDADYVVYVSRITWGGYSVPIKLYADRIIPLVHPYFRKVNGEMHHQLRYASLPVTLSVGYGARTDAEEATFIEYAASQRDQGGARRETGTFVVRRKDSVAGAAQECAEWLKREVAK